jgi:hypothetical protein
LPVELEVKKLSEQVVYLEDYDRPPDEECHIFTLFLQEERKLKKETGTKVILMDPILRKAYASLPPLR